jgi:hypothetical protein
MCILALLGAAMLASACDEGTDSARSQRASFILQSGSESFGTVAVDEDAGQLCYRIKASVKAAHLHFRNRQSPTDDVVVTLFEPGDGDPRSGCVTGVETRDLSYFLDHPGRHYVDLHLNPQDRIVVELSEAAQTS